MNFPLVFSSPVNELKKLLICLSIQRKRRELGADSNNVRFHQESVSVLKHERTFMIAAVSCDSLSSSSRIFSYVSSWFFKYYTLQVILVTLWF